LLYLLFARYLERIDLGLVLRQWWQSQVPGLSLPAWIIFMAEMLHPRVLRHLIPVLVGWWLAYRAAVSLVWHLYDLPDREAAGRTLARLRTSQPLSRKPVKVTHQTLASEREKSVLLRVGGPGRVRITSENVAVTELNGRFHRVLGPGKHRLGRFEYVHSVLDLRQQEREARNISLVTREGIEITTDLSVTFRISTGGEMPTKTKPFPYDEEAVHTVAYAVTVLDDKVTTWETVPLRMAGGKLAKIVSQYRLDELLYPRAIASEPHLTIRNELERQVRANLRDMGIELTNIHMGRLELPDEVSDQYIEYWRSHLETKIRLSQADGAAYTLEEMEMAHAEAEWAMIQSIVEGVQRAQHAGSMGSMREIVALRLIEALEKMAKQSQQVQSLPPRLLPRLGRWREELVSDSNLPVTEELDE
jgi:regulator of protease activity HflC (stomatin/prohibitin superfamily)